MCANKRASLQDKSPLDDLFGQQPKGRKAGQAEREVKTAQTTVILTEEQLLWLDEKCLEARKGGDKSISKTAIIRALIELARRCELDLEGINGEEEIVSRIEDTVKAT